MHLPYLLDKDGLPRGRMTEFDAVSRRVPPVLGRRVTCSDIAALTTARCSRWSVTLAFARLWWRLLGFGHVFFPSLGLGGGLFGAFAGGGGW